VILFHDVNHEFTAGSITSIRKAGLQDGTTTLLKCCAGIVSPRSGRIEYNGINIESLSERERYKRLSYCFEIGGMVSLFTLYNNFALPLLYHDVYPQNEIADRIFDVAEKLKIDHLLEKEPLQLTDVQLRLANLARALILDADALFIDELQAGMSRQLYDNVVAILLKQAAQGKVVVMVTTSGDDDAFAHHHLLVSDGILRGVN